MNTFGHVMFSLSMFAVIQIVIAKSVLAMEEHRKGQRLTALLIASSTCVAVAYIVGSVPYVYSLAVNGEPLGGGFWYARPFTIAALFMIQEPIRAMLRESALRYYTVVLTLMATAVLGWQMIGGNFQIQP